MPSSTAGSPPGIVDQPRNTKRTTGTAQERSASPDLKRNKHISNMKRTPQPTLTQSKLTFMLQPTGVLTATGASTEPTPIAAP